MVPRYSSPLDTCNVEHIETTAATSTWEHQQQHRQQRAAGFRIIELSSRDVFNTMGTTTESKPKNEPEESFLTAMSAEEDISAQLEAAKMVRQSRPRRTRALRNRVPSFEEQILSAMENPGQLKETMTRIDGSKKARSRSV